MRLEFEPQVTDFPLVENRDFEDDIAVSGDFESLLKKGVSAAQSGDRDHARKLLSQATAVNPASEDAWMWLASISEYPEELLAFLNRVLEINPENGRATEWLSATNSLLAKTFVQRAITAYEESSLERATQNLDQALTYDLDSDLAWFWKAKLAQSDDEKLEFLDRALKIDPENQDAQAAVTTIKRARSHAAFDEAKAAAAAGNRKKAAEILDNFVKDVPDSVQAWLLKSHLAAGLEGKIEALENALAIDPENAAARSGLEFLKLTFGSSDSHEEADACETNEAEGDQYPVELAAEQAPLVIPSENPVVVEFVPPSSPEDFVEEAVPNEVGSETEFEAANVDDEDVVTTVFEAATTYDEEQLTSDSAAVQEQVPEFEPNVDYRFEAEEALVRSAEDLFEPTAVPVDAQLETAEDPSDLVHEAFDCDSSVAESEGFVAEEVAPVVEEPMRFVEPQFDHVEPEFVQESSPFDALADETYTGFTCPYCKSPIEEQAIECPTCRATLTLSDIEALLSASPVDHAVVQRAVTAMEAEWNLREFDEQELTELGVGHLNLNNFESGFKYLQEASRLNPNNVMLAGHVNTIAIRLDEMRRQSQNYDAIPKGKTILIVDDSPTVRKLIAGKLEKSGHTVVCAVDGIDALAKLEEGMPDLVLLDITMPRMDGYEVCKQIRSNPAGRDLPVVMISGKDGFFDKVRGRMAGTTGYVTKPFGPETLMKALETYLLPDRVEVS